LNESLSLVILIYFIYGLAFYTLGIGAMLQVNNRYKRNPLLEAIPFLGMFGILHGTLEWLIMLSYTSLFASSYGSIRIVIGMLGTISFAFLWLFAVKLIYGKKLKEKFRYISISFVVMAIITYLLVHTLWNESFFLRILMGAPGAIFTGVGIVVIAKDSRYGMLKSISNRLYAMAGLFIAYGITQLISQQLFSQWLKLPIEVGRTVLAVLITISFESVVRVIKLENEKRLSYLVARQGIGEENKRIAREMHDIVLQDLFSIGLQLEQLDEHSCSDENKGATIDQLKIQLNGVMESIRSFIKTSMFEKNDMNDLSVKLQSMVMSLENEYEAKIVLINSDDEIEYGFLDLEGLNHIYYIVRECVINALKHSGGTTISIRVISSFNGLNITVIDDGCGFKLRDIEDRPGMGITAMIERINIISGELNFKSNESGTQVEIYLPWEE
jgi:signal transduction histidine kinase